MEDHFSGQSMCQFAARDQYFNLFDTKKIQIINLANYLSTQKVQEIRIWALFVCFGKLTGNGASEQKQNLRKEDIENTQ